MEDRQLGNKYSPYPGDVIDAKLEPGEYVVNRNAVKAIGKKNLDKLNNEVAPRFQEGGQARSFSPFKSQGAYRENQEMNASMNQKRKAYFDARNMQANQNRIQNPTQLRKADNITFIDLHAIKEIPTNPEFNTDDFNKVLGPMSQNMREYKDNYDQHQRQLMRTGRKWYQKKIAPTPAEIAQMARVEGSLKQSKQKDALYQQEMAVRSQSEKRDANARDAQQRHSSSQIADNMRSFQRQSEMMELGSGPKAPIDPKTGERHMTVAEGFDYDSEIASNRNALIEKQRAAQKAKHDAIMASKMDGPELEVQVVGNKWSPPPYEKVKQNDSGERKSGGLGAAYRNFKAGMQVKKYGKQDGGYIPEDGKQGYLIGGLALGATALGALGKGKQSFDEAGGMAGIREKMAQRKADREAAYLASTDRDTQATAADTTSGKAGAAVMGTGQAIAGGVSAVGAGLKYARDENKADNYADVWSGEEKGSIKQRAGKGLGILGGLLQDASMAQGFEGANWEGSGLNSFDGKTDNSSPYKTAMLNYNKENLDGDVELGDIDMTDSNLEMNGMMDEMNLTTPPATPPATPPVTNSPFDEADEEAKFWADNDEGAEKELLSYDAEAEQAKLDAKNKEDAADIESFWKSEGLDAPVDYGDGVDYSARESSLVTPDDKAYDNRWKPTQGPNQQAGDSKKSWEDMQRESANASDIPNESVQEINLKENTAIKENPNLATPYSTVWDPEKGDWVTTMAKNNYVKTWDPEIGDWKGEWKQEGGYIDGGGLGLEGFIQQSWRNMR